MIILNTAKMLADETGRKLYYENQLLWDLLNGMEVYIETFDEDGSKVQRMVMPIHDGEGKISAAPVDMEWCDQVAQRQYIPPRGGVQAVVSEKPEGVHNATLYVDGKLDGAFAAGRGFWRKLKKAMKEREKR